MHAKLKVQRNESFSSEVNRKRRRERGRATSKRKKAERVSGRDKRQRPKPLVCVQAIRMDTELQRRIREKKALRRRHISAISGRSCCVFHSGAGSLASYIHLPTPACSTCLLKNSCQTIQMYAWAHKSSERHRSCLHLHLSIRNMSF